MFKSTRTYRLHHTHSNAFFKAKKINRAKQYVRECKCDFLTLTRHMVYVVTVVVHLLGFRMQNDGQYHSYLIFSSFYTIEYKYFPNSISNFSFGLARRSLLQKIDLR